MARRLARTLLVALALSLMLAPAVAEAGPRPQPFEVRDDETSFRELINQERGEHGLRMLRMRGKLVRLARRHSVNMAAHGAIFHNPGLAQDLRHVQWSLAAENIGVGSSIPALHDAFMDSASHRENVLRSRFDGVGIGTYYAQDRLWVTVVFIG